MNACVMFVNKIIKIGIECVLRSHVFPFKLSREARQIIKLKFNCLNSNIGKNKKVAPRPGIEPGSHG